MTIRLIYSLTSNDVLGINNDLPYKIPKDINFFKVLTTNNIVVMGRRTYESIEEKYRPLPNRKNIVVSSIKGKDPIQSDYDDISKVTYVGTVTNALFSPTNTQNKNIYVIGGKSILEESFQYADEVLITIIHKDAVYNDSDIVIKKPDIDLSNMKKYMSKIYTHQDPVHGEIKFQFYRYKK